MVKNIFTLRQPGTTQAKQLLRKGKAEKVSKKTPTHQPG
jgi:hypothetical protein